MIESLRRLRSTLTTSAHRRMATRVHVAMLPTPGERLLHLGRGPQARARNFRLDARLATLEENAKHWAAKLGLP
jgi:hypothetical protein